MVTASDLAVYVNVRDYTSEPVLENCFDTAVQMVTDFVEDNEVPESILDRATLAVGAELFYAKSAKNGIAQYASAEGAAPTRIARDPMVAAYPLLRRYVLPF